MRVLMVGVDSTRKGGMWSVAKNYLSDPRFCECTHLAYIPTSTLGSSYGRLLFFSKALFCIRRFLRKQKVDIVHIHMAENGSTFRAGIVEWLSKRHGCKVVLQIHAEYKNWYFSQGRRVQSKIAKILQRADCLLVFGAYWRDFLSEIVGEDAKIKILYNGVSIPALNPYRQDAYYLLFFAVIDRKKGILDLLEAVQRIDGQLSPEVKLAICGVDKDGEVQSLIRSMGLSHRVEMLGWIDAAQKEKIFARTCIHILPSYSEAFPMSILETMAYGIPNISTEIAAIPEMIQNGETGILIRPGDIDALAEAIGMLVLDKQKRMKMSEKAYQSVRQRFNLQQQKQKLISVYEELLEVEKDE